MKKLDVIRKNMKKEKVDLLVLQTTPNIRYLLDIYGVSFGSLVCIPKKEPPFIISSLFDSITMKKTKFETITFSKNFKADMKTENKFSALKKILKKKKLKGKIATEKIYMNQDLLKEFSKIKNPKDFTIPMDMIRSIKTPKEIKIMRAGAKITVKGMKAVSEFIRPGVTEREIARTFEYEVRKKSDWFSFETIAGSGPNTAEPHHIITNRKIKKTDIVMVDCGIVYKNLCTDMTRTFCLKPGEKEKKLLNLLLKAQKMQIEKIKPGMKISSLDSVPRKFLKKYGYEIIHGTGHGVGIEVHEVPSLHPDSKDILKPNMIFTIEPALYVKGIGGVRIEDMVLLTKKGKKILTKFPRRLW